MMGHRLGKVLGLAFAATGLALAMPVNAQAPASLEAPAPKLSANEFADWLFVFKLNAATFPSSASSDRHCTFGGSPKPYPAFSQQYAFASSKNPVLTAGAGLAGSDDNDPLGATFGEAWRGSFHYVVWNDQFYQHPKIAGCADSCSAPWGHSKGMLVWNDAGEGMVLQVTTPSWPAAASAAHPREDDGNTLGCTGDNNVKVSQDFFALKLSEADVEKVLDGLANASVVTDISNPELVQNGGPPAIEARVSRLGARSSSTAPLDLTLSSGVRLISKPSKLNVPPWQLVSAMLGGIDMRTATWWTNPAIPSTLRTSRIDCWSQDLGKPGAVAVATSGHWQGKEIGLKGGPSPDANHAKVGIATSGSVPLTVFGDMNQQGALSGNCASSQNGRGGLFFVLDNAALHDSVASLLQGQTAPTTLPVKRRASRR